MLSYQHIYHAGCMSDVHKHRALSIILSKMVEKDKPLTYMETHAGRGLYNLTSPEALKTGEAISGIKKMLSSGKIPEENPYRKTIELIRKECGKNAYPGSPMIAKTILRDCDKIFLAELHPQEYESLLKNMKYKNVSIIKRDGYEAVIKASPPPIRRGFVLIDPSYEIKTEYAQAADFIIRLHKKWSVAVIMVWYPILENNNYKNIVRELLKQNFPKLWHHEIIFNKNDVNRAIGSGLICINTPFGIEKELNEIMVSYA